MPDVILFKRFCKSDWERSEAKRERRSAHSFSARGTHRTWRCAATLSDSIGFTRSHILLLTGRLMRVLASDRVPRGTGLLSVARRVTCTGLLR